MRMSCLIFVSPVGHGEIHPLSSEEEVSGYIMSPNLFRWGHRTMNFWRQGNISLNLEIFILLSSYSTPTAVIFYRQNQIRSNNRHLLQSYPSKENGIYYAMESLLHIQKQYNNTAYPEVSWTTSNNVSFSFKRIESWDNC